MSKFELTKIPIKKGAYQKPERQNRNIPDVKYDKVDKTCEEEVFLSNDGNVYVPEDSMSTIFNTDTKRAQYIYMITFWMMMIRDVLMELMQLNHQSW